MVSAPSVKGLICPNCGAAITLRTGAQAQTVVCDNCHAVLDAKDPNLKILQKFDEKMTWRPEIPLGTRGTLKGDQYEAIGFQVRAIREDGVDYSWREYVLWNPYTGYRYLSEYDGHWNDIVVTTTPPTELSGGLASAVEFHGETFKHFQTARSTTVFILGEFPWQVKRGDRVRGRDFVSPPQMLSEEKTDQETTWSVGTYTTPQRIWEAFKLPGSPHEPRGVFENQPDDYAPAAKDLSALFGIFTLLLLVLLMGRMATAGNTKVFEESFQFRPGGGDSSALVTKVFPITGRTSNVEVDISADVSNSWAYFNLALINEGTGKAIDFGREVSYYFGSDADGSWSEGSSADRSFLPTVPAGNYFLRVQPEGPADVRRFLTYRIVLRRDVPRLTWFLIALALLAAVPLIAVFRAWGFETKRWKESDHPLVVTQAQAAAASDDDDDTEDSFKGAS